MFPIDNELPPPDSIDGQLLRLIEDDETNLAQRAAAQLPLTRQAINKRLRALADAGVVIASGQTKSRRYTLKTISESRKFPIGPEFDEGTVWRRFVAPHLEGLKEAWAICHYAFTEIYNNAIDHSEGTQVVVNVTKTPATVALRVIDNGIGIFQKLQNTYGYADEREALLELVKGRLTTDPTRHTGWGIFFTSRMCDYFLIQSGRYSFSHNAHQEPALSDWCFEEAENHAGTAVHMIVDTRPRRTVNSVLEAYSVPNSIGLNITHVPLSLSQFGEERLISRSQAKHVSFRLDWFKQVILDFAGVPHIGQAFADELFRVWQRDHPEVRLIAINTTPEIDTLIQGAQAALEAE